MKPELVIGEHGAQEWYLNGKLHRTDGPAVEWADGDKWWYLNGKLHRTDGPAIESVSGARQWWVDNKLHRTTGPAIECASGTREWWVDGVEYPFTERLQLTPIPEQQKLLLALKYCKHA